MQISRIPPQISTGKTPLHIFIHFVSDLFSRFLTGKLQVNAAFKDMIDLKDLKNYFGELNKTKAHP